MNGWLKLYRGLLEKPIWTEAKPEQKVILLTILMMANYEERKWEWGGKVYSLQPGQFVTSLPSLVQKCGKGVTVQNVRTALKRFVRYGFITDESTNRNRLITITNWDDYQRNACGSTDNEMDNQQTKNREITNNQQAADRQLTDGQQPVHRQRTSTKKERSKERKEERNKNKINARINEFTLDLTKGEMG